MADFLSSFQHFCITNCCCPADFFHLLDIVHVFAACSVGPTSDVCKSILLLFVQEAAAACKEGVDASVEDTLCEGKSVFRILKSANITCL